MIDPTSSKSWAEAEYRIKLRNKRGPWTADNILMEEVAEAFNAYSRGELEHALQEFAQCGAVILRIMETIEKEMK
jgi:NTP pyrophosphatase (non-canonical NTP hydrolase)